MGAASAGGESLVSVGNSALFDSANSEYLSRTPSSAGNRDTWTISYWVYKTYITGAKAFFTAGSNNTNVTELRDQGTGILEYRHQDGGSVTDNIITTLGKRGAEYKNVLFESPVPQDTIDVSGAGDTFTAAFIVRYFETQDERLSIQYANQKASEVVSRRGVVTPI